MRKGYLAAGIAALLLSTVPAAANAANGDAPVVTSAIEPTRERPCQAPPVPPSDPPLEVDPDQLAAPAGTGRPADPAETAMVQAGIDNFLACLNSGDHRKASALFTPRFVRDYMGQQDYEEVSNILGGMRIDDMRISGVTVYADGSFTTEGKYVAYGHSLVNERQYWWRDDDGYLKLNWTEALPSEIPRHAVRVAVDMGEYFFRLSQTRICAPAGTVVLDIRNVGAEPHEAILVQLPDGATPADIFNGRLTPDQVRTIGQGGANAVLSLVRVRPGTYWLIDFIPAPDGVPHAVHGQVARLTVERQASACSQGNPEGEVE
ncbi:hypothetical protein [Actinopolymorpha pittospori]|uniref:DUF4440 domain-containing protein n=1 Tax=Actinopolymorpha pittospori TaxID=648752 RepID=A0A927MZD3_9ACTN|nr:hypothetical protein [Actinopolymorpha pittospori]MBE1609354.1 hypothetical protein [Actinopolymorpha pittospori]